MFALTLVAFGLALGGLESDGNDQPDHNKVISLDLPQRQDFEVSVPVAGQDKFSAPGAAESVLPQDQWEVVTVQPGQTLDRIFHLQGFSAKTLQEILAINQATGKLKKIRPGDLFEFQRYPDKSFKRMRYAVDEANYLVIERVGHESIVSTQQRLLTTEPTMTSGVIESSLFLAGKQAGLSDGMVMKLANLFGWDIDFVLDIRTGDRFCLMYEKIYRDGSFLRDGEIIGATFFNQGEKYQAIRFKTNGVSQYFAPDGRNMRKAFLRAPLNFSYVSSNFNPKRYHPILKRVKPHNGIDYRAPKGTPVIAAGDGKVIRSAYNQYNGNYVFIQHANSIVTKYLHFNKRVVKQGERVKQGQLIGYVGSTGLAQAPHLHYEFVVNGVHRNPRTVALPTANPLEATQLAMFRRSAAPVLSELSRLESASLYANNNP